MKLFSPWHRPWLILVGLLVVGISIFYGLIYRDIVSRAKESYMAAERYMEWATNPEKKKADIQNKFLASKEKLDQKKAAQKISEEEYRQELEMMEFDRELELQESSIKYAYQWYKDTYELFSPPESRWVRRAREKAPIALNLWKKELEQMKIPTTSLMLE